MKSKKQFICNATGEVVTIVNKDPLYIKLSNGQTLPYHLFNQWYDAIKK